MPRLRLVGGTHDGWTYDTTPDLNYLRLPKRMPLPKIEASAAIVPAEVTVEMEMYVPKHIAGEMCLVLATD